MHCIPFRMHLSHSGPSDALSSLRAAAEVPSEQASVPFWKQSRSGAAHNKRRW